MADANHSAPIRFRDCFVNTQTSTQSRRVVPHVRLADRAPLDAAQCSAITGEAR